jgi:hypothetical protein
MSDEATVEVYPPSCGQVGCRHHYAKALSGCACPAYWDAAGYHTVEVNSRCTAHRMPVDTSQATGVRERQILADYQAALSVMPLKVGDQVTISGTVTEISSDTVVIETGHGLVAADPVVVHRLAPVAPEDIST